jgi:hypothetical protein
VGFTDLDWVGDVDDWKSTSGYTFNLGGSYHLVQQKQKEHAITLSSTEVEYQGLSMSIEKFFGFNNYSQSLLSLGSTYNSLVQ